MYDTKRTARRSRLIGWLSLVALLFVGLAYSQAGYAAEYKKVVRIPVDQGIERGLESFLERAFTTAEKQGADLVILDINTPGGEVNAADQIGALVRQAPMHVIAFIDNQAFSAGTYIALNANEIVMTPGASIGAAAPIDRAGNTADIKTISAWSEKMEAAAKLNHRNPDIARAMVEVETEFPGIKPKGTVLSLEAQHAKQVGYADRLVANEAALFQALGVSQDQVTDITPTLGEKVARIVTSPYVMSLLLVIGLVGLAIELIVPGFGIAGTIGICAFALYFFGHVIAGFASGIHIALFVIGVLMLIMEIFLPGGIVGTLGVISMVSGLVLAAYDTEQGLASLGIAALITAVVIVVLVKYLGVRGMWSKFILKTEQSKESGYVAPRDQSSLIGKEGIAITPMHPSGMIRIDGKRIDAVSVGGFIKAGTPIYVIQVEGTRIVVQEQEQ
ncbi:UNVERIFIED_CONTAM: membrane-bound serine protease (ClpP class) [Brevibacillus sp. OAP136]